MTGKEEVSGGRIVHDNIKTEPTKVTTEKPSVGKSKPVIATPEASMVLGSESGSSELRKGIKAFCQSEVHVATDLQAQV